MKNEKFNNKIITIQEADKLKEAIFNEYCQANDIKIIGKSLSAKDVLDLLDKFESYHLNWIVVGKTEDKSILRKHKTWRELQTTIKENIRRYGENIKIQVHRNITDQYFGIYDINIPMSSDDGLPPLQIDTEEFRKMGKLSPMLALIEQHMISDNVITINILTSTDDMINDPFNF